MADDLNTEIKIGADASGVEAGVGRAKRSLKSLGDAAQQAGKDAGAGMGAIGAGGDKSAKDVERATRTMQNSIQRLIAEQKAGAKGSREYWEALANTRGVNTAALRPLLDQLDAAKSATNAAKGAAESWRDSLGKIGPMVAAAFSGAALAGFIGKVVSVQREFDVLNSSLKTVTGSSAAAEREMAWLKDFAKETPFGLAQATQGFVKMKALGLDPTRAALTSFGNTASAMGKDLNQMIEAVADASTGEFERLKEFGIKAKKEGDQVSLTFQGVTTTIGNSAREITQYLENIGNTSFGGAMEERAKTLDGTIAALGDTWDELFRTVSTNNVGSLIFDSVTLANGALEDATTILRAMGGAAQDASRDTGALSTIQNGIATVFETVAVLGANLKFVLVGIGTEIGGLAAQVAQAAQFNFAGVRAIREQMVADAEAARREIDATTERILNARKAQEEYARWSTRNASAATDPRRVDLGGPASNGGGTNKPGKPKKEELSDYDKLIQKLGQEIPKAAAEAEAAQMGYNKAQTEFLALAASPAWAKFTNDQRATVAALFENKIASEQSAEAAKTLAKANLDAAASREKYIASLATGLDKIQADIAAQIEATERMGLSKQAIADLDAAKLEMLATDLELQAIKAMDRNLDQQTYDALKKQAAAYRELGIAKKGGAAKEAALEMEKANAEAAKKAQEDWERASEQINNTLTDALMRGFESGKDFAKNLRDTVVNMFKTMVLRPVISAIVNPVAGAITGALGLSTAAQAGQGGVSSGVSTALSGASLLGSVGGSLAAGAGWLTGATTLGGSLSAGMSLLGTGSLAGAGAGLGMLAGALGPIALGVGLLSSAFSRKLKDQGIQGTLGGEAGFEGQQYRFYKGGLFRSDKTTYSAIDPELARMLAGGFSAVQDQVTDFAEALSLPTDRIKGFTTDIKVSFKGLDEAGIQKALQDALATGSNELAQQVLGTLTTTTREVTETLASGMDDGTMQTVTRTIEETTYAASEFARDGEKAIDTLTRLATSVTTVNTIWENLGFTLYDASLRGADAASKMADAFGGLENLAAVTGVYYENFYSDAEKTANITRDITKALAGVGLELPKTRQEFRSLVEAQMALGESGTTAVKTLLEVSGAFASITEAAGRAVDAASLERKDRLAAQRAQEKAQAEALQKQIKDYADGAEQFNVLRDSLLKAGDAAGLLAAVTERAFADPSGRYMNGRYELPRWEEGTTAAGYNYQYGMMQRRLIGQAINDASFNALRIQNVSGLLGELFQRAAPNEYDTVSGPIRQAIQQAIVGASGDMSNAVRDAVSGAALYVATSGTGFSSNEPGLAAIRNARAAASSASLYSRDSETGLYRIGGGAVAYGQALDNLKGTLSTGKITTDQFTRAVEALNEALPGAADSLGTFADLVAVQQGANYGIGLAGLESIKFYFKSLISLSDDFTKAAEVAAEPIAKATEVINRLGSVQHVFSESTRAALDGFKGAGAYGRATLDDPETADSISRANAIAEAAGIAASVLTTADAAAAAVKLAKSPAFAELDAAGIRDASLLLDGISQYNAQGFEVAFTRISAALAKGSVTDAQYKALFDVALDVFKGVPEETRTLIDSMTRLRDAMSGFADGLLIDEQRTTLSADATLAEMQRQYAQAFAGAATGDNEAIGKYQQLANTLLDKDLYSTQAEYNAVFGSVYGDARQLEAIGVNTLANAQGDAMVAELKDMNAKLNKRVEDLEKNLMAALAQIAKNTSDTSRGIEQQIVMAEDTP